MTTIHAYTGDQTTVDSSHKDLRRARAAGLSMIPTTTGAAKSLGEVIPAIKGKLDGSSIRVPTANVSVIDLIVNTQKSTNLDEMKEILINASNHSMKNIINISQKPLVSVDFNGMKASACVDLMELYVMGDKMVRILAWYDNEVGFSHRMLDNILIMGRI